MVRTANLRFTYDSKGEVFNFPDILLKSDENLLVLGKSGVGKTTLLHLLAGLLTPMSGSIEIEEMAIHTLSNRQMDCFRGHTIGMLFQRYHANRSLNVMENLQARLFLSRKAINQTIILDLLEQLDLVAHKNKKVTELSEGQLQRLGIALSVVHQPKIILADEPTSSLDDENCNAVMQLLLNQAKIHGANLITITHDHRIKPFFKNMMTL